MAKQIRSIPPAAIAALRESLEALRIAEAHVAAWFSGPHCRTEWLGGDPEANAYSAPPGWVAVMARKDINTIDKLWLIDAALGPQAAFDFDNACQVIRVGDYAEKE
jgi:hypothetical protein